MNKELNKQLNEFRDKVISEDYKRLTIPQGQIIVEIFVEDLSNGDTNKPEIFVFDEEGGTVSAKDLLYKKATHIARVLVSNTPDYSERDIVLLKPGDCIGETWNPEFLHLHQFSRSSGIEPIVPKGMKEKVTKFQAHMNDSAFLLPDECGKKVHEIFTYIIHSNRVQAKWEL
jgi:hypothetical protein